MDRERHIDIQNLKRYPEFHALKQEMEKFCQECESLQDVELSEHSRLTFNEEIAARIIAAQKVRDLLSTLGLVDKSKPRIIDRTGE